MRRPRAPMTHRVRVRRHFRMRGLARVHGARVPTPRERELRHEEAQYECGSTAGTLSHHDRITSPIAWEFPRRISGSSTAGLVPENPLLREIRRS